jgi:hypothetical protein
MHLYTAPEHVPFTVIEHTACIFLAGSINMGKAIDWQAKVIDALQNTDVAVFNPRRVQWDPSWTQSINNPDFNTQVNWELDQLVSSDLVFFYFQGDTLSPVSLMELGITVAAGYTAIVVAEPNFWRRGNIEVVCKRYGIQLHADLDAGIADLCAYLGRWA